MSFFEIEYITNKANELKQEISDYIIEDKLEMFLKDLYSLCYNQYYEYEKEKSPKGIETLTSDEVLAVLIEFCDSMRHTPIKELKGYSRYNHFWYVSDIFEKRPKRYGVRGDSFIWEYFVLFFEIFELAIDCVTVEEIVDITNQILDIYFKYAKRSQYNGELMKEYWNEVLEELIQARYTMLNSEMKLLCGHNRLE